MELVCGMPITEYCDQARLSARERLQLFVKVCQAIQHAHQKGVIHRDLKPSNVLVTLHDGTPVPKVIDFGVAKAINQRLSEHTVYTRMAQIVGTPMYMSPEQAELSGLDVDTRSDVYSLGVLLYELLTGTTPFAKETLNQATFDEMRRMIREVEPPHPSQRVSTLEARTRLTVSGKRGVDGRQFARLLAGELDWIVMKALEKDRQRRYESASAFAADIQRYLADQPVEACPPSAIYRLRKFARRNKTTLTAAIIVATVLLGGAAAAAVLHEMNLARYNTDLTRLNEDLQRATTRAQSLQHVAEENERRTGDALYAADINRAASSLEGGDTRGALVLLNRHSPGPDEPDRRGFEWWYLHRRAGRAHRVLLDSGSPLYILCPSPDRRILATAGQDAIVRLFDPETGAVEKEIATGQIEVNGVAFSPDGKELATAGDDGTIRIWVLATGAERLQIAAHPEKAFQLLYTPDGARIVSCGDDPDIRVFAADSGRLLQTLRGHQRGIQSLLLVDAQTLVSTSDDFTARCWRLDTQTETSRVTSAGHVWAVAAGPERDLLITGNGDNEIEAWNLREQRKISQVRHLDSIQSLALHPAGGLLAAGDHGGSIRLWRLGAGGQISPDDYRVWQAHQGSTYSLIWSRDGSRLISAGKDGRVISWNLVVEDTHGPKRFKIDPSSSFCLIPGTTSLVASGGDHRALVRWNWSAGTAEGRFTEEANYQQVCVSPDATLLAAIRGRRVLEVLPIEECFLRPPQVRRLLLDWNPGGKVGEVRFSPDSQSVAVPFQTDDTEGQPAAKHLWLHGPPKFGRREQLPVPGVAQAAFSPDSQRLALATVAGLVLWDISRREALWERAQPDTTLVAFSEDGKLLMTGGQNRLVVVWNAQDGSIRFRLAGHRSSILSLSISPDGDTLATASRDGVIKLWHVPTGQELFELREAGSCCRCLQFTRDGLQLLALVDGNPEHDEILVFDATRE
jgi:WD40 repeat protein